MLSPSSGKPYGLTRVCRIWRSARASVYRHRHPAPARQRPGPAGPMPDEPCWNGSGASSPTAPFTARVTGRSGLGCGSATFARGSRRVLRLMRENDLLAPGRAGRPRGPRNHNGTIIADSLDTMWGTDMTTTWTAEGQVAVLATHLLASAIDHHNAECVGIHAARRGTRFEALEPLRQDMRRHFGANGKDVARGLAVRHDHGSQCMSDTFLTEMCFLGIQSSPAFTPGAGRQRLRRTLHPDAQGEPAVDPDLRHRRRSQAGAARVPRHLQHHLARPAPRIPLTGPGQTGSAFSRRHRCVGYS